MNTSSFRVKDQGDSMTKIPGGRGIQSLTLCVKFKFLVSVRLWFACHDTI